MDLSRALLGDVPTLVAVGAVEGESCDALRAELDRLFDARYNVIFLDLTEVVSIDADALAVLHHGVEALGKRGWLGLIGPSAEVSGLLETDGILDSPRIRLFRDRQAARVVTGERAST